MSFLANLFTGGASGLIETAGKVVDEFVTTDEERQAGELALYQAETERQKVTQSGELVQAQANIEAAKHPSLFVAGARPCILWVCAVAMAYHFLVFPLASPFLEELLGFALHDLEWRELSIVMMGMLGFGGMRAYEKTKGVARENMKGAAK